MWRKFSNQRFIYVIGGKRSDTYVLEANFQRAQYNLDGESANHVLMQQKLVIVLKNDALMVTWGTKEQQENTMRENLKVLHGKEPRLPAKNTFYNNNVEKLD